MQKVSPLSRFVWLGLLGFPILVYAIGATLNVQSLNFDNDTKKLSVVYTSGKKEISLTDSGPVLLCVLNRLLKRKYDYSPGQTVAKEDISRDDLRILHHAAFLLPEKERQALTKAIRAYMKADPKSPSTVFDALVSSIRTGLKDHETAFEEKTFADSEETEELRTKLSKLEARIKAILGDSKEDELEADEKKLVQRLTRDRDELKKKIAAAAPKAKIEKGTESPADYSLCVKDESSKSRTGISNENTGELLGKASDLLKKMLPDKGTLLRDGDDH